MALTVINVGSCLMQVKWDFADNSNHGKWSYPHQVYRHLRPPIADAEYDTYDTGSSLVVTKNRIRGRGRALKIKYSAEPDKDLVIVGWATTLKGTTSE